MLQDGRRIQMTSPAPYLRTMSAVGLITMISCCSGQAERAEETAQTGQSRAACAAAEPVVVDPGQVLARLRPDSRTLPYAPLAAAEQAALTAVMREIFVHTAAGAAPVTCAQVTAWRARAQRAGYALEHWQVDGDVYLALVEEPMRRRGGGSYVVRLAPSASTPVLLQAPHAYFDTSTGHIAVALFFTSPGRARLRALYMNSMHRYQLETGERRRQEQNPADVCHNREHVFQALTGVAADVLVPLQVVQLHGFGDRSDSGGHGDHAGPLDDDQGDEHELEIEGTGEPEQGPEQGPEQPTGESPEQSGDQAGDQAGGQPPGDQPPGDQPPGGVSIDVIVSTASQGRSDDGLTHALAGRLEVRFPDAAVRRFPGQYEQLGGLTNVQRRMLIRRSGPAFVHLEMSQQFRRHLRKSKKHRMRFFAALCEGLDMDLGTAGAGVMQGKPGEEGI